MTQSTAVILERRGGEMSQEPVELEALERDLADAAKARQEQLQGGAPSCYTDAELSALRQLAQRLRAARDGRAEGPAD
jgi:hypothetical protein